MLWNQQNSCSSWSFNVPTAVYWDSHCCQHQWSITSLPVWRLVALHVSDFPISTWIICGGSGGAMSLKKSRNPYLVKLQVEIFFLANCFYIIQKFTLFTKMRQKHLHINTGALPLELLSPISWFCTRFYIFRKIIFLLRRPYTVISARFVGGGEGVEGGGGGGLTPSGASQPSSLHWPPTF